MNSILKNCIVSLLLLLITACGKEETKNQHNCKAPIVINLEAVVSNLPLELQTSLYNDYLGRKYKIELLKFYLSNWALEKSNGELIYLDEINLIDFSSDELLNIEADVDTGIYVNLHFGIGLDSLTNALDPSEFETSHPMSIAQNTYWTWASKYKFFMIEGRIDTMGGNTPDLIFSYHTGFNDLYREVSIPLNNLVIDHATDVLQLELDIDQVVNGTNGTIDFVDQSFSHSIDELTVTISNNLVGAFSIH